jgi:caspase domain-containing protein
LGRVKFKHGYAVVVGVGADLPETVKDAVGLANALRDPNRCAYPKQQVKLLTRREANRDGILCALTWLADQCRMDPHATAIIFYSGHGGELDDAGPYFLVPHGYDQDRFTETAIQGEEFIARVKAVAAERLLVLLDCCHAAGLADARPKGLPKSFVQKPMPPDFNRLLAIGSGRAIVASCRADELSWTGSPYSVFTGALLEGLAGYGAGDLDGLVRLLDVVNWIDRKVPARTNQRQHPILDFARVQGFPMAYYAGGQQTPKKLEWSQESLDEPGPGLAGSGPKDTGKLYKAIAGVIALAALGLTAYWAVYGDRTTDSKKPKSVTETRSNRSDEQAWTDLDRPRQAICRALSNAMELRESLGEHGQLVADFERPMTRLRDDIKSIPYLMLENVMEPSKNYFNAFHLHQAFDRTFFPDNKFTLPSDPKERQSLMNEVIDELLKVDADKRCITRISRVAQ